MSWSLEDATALFPGTLQDATGLFIDEMPLPHGAISNSLFTGRDSIPSHHAVSVGWQLAAAGCKCTHRGMHRTTHAVCTACIVQRRYWLEWQLVRGPRVYFRPSLPAASPSDEPVLATIWPILGTTAGELDNSSQQPSHRVCRGRYAVSSTTAPYIQGWTIWYLLANVDGVRDGAWHNIRG